MVFAIHHGRWMRTDQPPPFYPYALWRFSYIIGILVHSVVSALIKICKDRGSQIRNQKQRDEKNRPNPNCDILNEDVCVCQSPLYASSPYYNFLHPERCWNVQIACDINAWRADLLCEILL